MQAYWTGVKRTLSSANASNRVAKRLSLGVAAQFREALRTIGMTQLELARRIDAKPASVCRDLNGGLDRAKLERIQLLAEAIEHDVVVMLRARPKAQRRSNCKVRDSAQ